jgi:hypothetical protein
MGVVELDLEPGTHCPGGVGFERGMRSWGANVLDHRHQR